MAKNLKPGEKPILFSGPMVQAILNTRPSVWPPEPIDPAKPLKWQTRRLPSKRVIDKWYEYDDWCNAVRTYEKSFYEHYPPCEVGQRLWVREKWGDIGSYDDGNGYRTHYAYAADFAYGTGFHEYSGDLYIEDEIHWKPPRFMPKAAARIWLEVKNVAITRLQDISVEDCLAEGIEIQFPHPKPPYISLAYGKQVLKPAYIDAYQTLWESTIQKKDLPLYGWNANPWVWVYEFGRAALEDSGMP